MSFALYGKTPSVERETRSLINQSLNECHVELRFEVGGQVWRAVRALRRRGQAGHTLALLESDEPDAQTLETVTGERAVNDRVAQLLGMDFAAFCRSVLLAQNRFSEFLHATPTERDRVLKNVFGYERLAAAHDVARLRLALAEARLAELEKRSSQVEEARALLKEAQASEAAAKQRLQQLQAVAGELEAAGSDRARAVAESESLQVRMDQLTDLARDLPRSDEVTSALEVAADSTQSLADARARSGSAQAARAEREAELNALIERLGDRQKILSFERLAVQQEEQASVVTKASSEVHRCLANSDRARDALTAGSKAVQKGAADVSAAEDALAAASAKLAEAQAGLLQAQHAEMALELRATLSPGEPCPVCRQPVHKLPPKGAASKVAPARRGVAAAQKAQDRARRAKESAASSKAAAEAAVAEATKTADRADEDLARAQADLADAETALASTKTQLTEWLGEGDIRSLLQARADELTSAEESLEASKALVEAARDEADAAVEIHERAAATLASLATALAGTWGRLGRTRHISPGEVGAAYVELGEAIVAAGDEARQGLEAARSAAEAAESAMASLMVGVGLSPQEDFRSALSQSEVDHATAAARAGELGQRVAAEAELRVEMDEARGRREIAARLAEDLKPSRFLAFLLLEERTELAELGSDHFELLTDGGFRFAQGGDFDIADLDAGGSVRKADSLSGGETFIASLALALALAQMVARTGGSLDSFFLDEGFGSLDPEHLDRAMEGISRLVAEDDRRLVVVVSHVAEMREAIEDLIVLDRNPLTGDSVIRSGASLGA